MVQFHILFHEISSHSGQNGQSSVRTHSPTVIPSLHVPCVDGSHLDYRWVPSGPMSTLVADLVSPTLADMWIPLAKSPGWQRTEPLIA